MHTPIYPMIMAGGLQQVIVYGAVWPCLLGLARSPGTHEWRDVCPPPRPGCHMISLPINPSPSQHVLDKCLLVAPLPLPLQISQLATRWAHTQFV